MEKNNNISHRNINRSFFHKQFICQLVNEYFYAFTKIINETFDDITKNTELNKLKNNYEDKILIINLTRKLIFDKTKNINYELMKQYFKNIVYIKDIINSLNDNYIRMNSVKNPDSIIKPNDFTMFIYIYTKLMNDISLEIYHFEKSNDIIDMEKKKVSIYKLIRKSIKKSLNECMVFNFIPSIENETIKIINNKGKYITIDRQKLLKYYEDNENYNNVNDEYNNENIYNDKKLEKEVINNEKEFINNEKEVINNEKEVINNEKEVINNEKEVINIKKNDKAQLYNSESESESESESDSEDELASNRSRKKIINNKK
jgi:hypothetical protein